MSDHVKLVDLTILSDKKYRLQNVSFDIKKHNGAWQRKHWEVYDHGNAATVLLFNRQKKTIILVKQFRIVVYLGENETTGFLLETCAGLLDGETPKNAIIREIEEETGYRVTEVKQVYEAFTSAGALSEKLYFFIAEYHPGQMVSKGGGLEEEHEDIEVIEMPFDEAVNKLRNGEIRDVKTIVLLQYALLQNLFE